MRRFMCAVAGLVLAGGPAAATNICQAGKLACATTMPVGGYCECVAQGVPQDGTVVAKAPPHTKINASGGGCGAHPDAPGCK